MFDLLTLARLNADAERQASEKRNRLLAAAIVSHHIEPSKLTCGHVAAERCHCEADTEFLKSLGISE